jgi:hypothetical protein
MSGGERGVDLRDRLEELLDDHRAMLGSSLDGLTEEEARRSLVPSRTTLLGLVKHATYVEKIWCDQAVTGRTEQQMGVAASPACSFVLRREDTVESLRAAHRQACQESREILGRLELGDTVHGRGERVVWAIRLHLLRELAQHCGHADILREQVLAARSEHGEVG